MKEKNGRKEGMAYGKRRREIRKFKRTEERRKDERKL